VTQHFSSVKGEQKQRRRGYTINARSENEEERERERALFISLFVRLMVFIASSWRSLLKRKKNNGIGKLFFRSANFTSSKSLGKAAATTVVVDAVGGGDLSSSRTAEIPALFSKKERRRREEGVKEQEEKRVVRRIITNETLLRFASLNDELERTVRSHRGQGLRSLLIAAVEHSRTKDEAERTRRMTEETIRKFPSEMHALKLSALGATFNESLCERLTMDIAEAAREVGASGLCVDAEEDFLNEQVDAVSLMLMRAMNKSENDGDTKNAAVYKTYQMYRKDSVEKLKRDIATAESEGFVLGAKLVRGAYLNIDRGKGVLFETKKETDESFADGLAFALKSIRERKKDNQNSHVKILLATRNTDNISSALGYSDDVQFAQLMGMDDEVTLSLLKKGERVAKYFPYGKFTETLPYLWRRCLERAAFS